jgi:hypothetical protein
LFRDEAGALFICLVRNVLQGCARVQKTLYNHNVGPLHQEFSVVIGPEATRIDA